MGDYEELGPNPTGGDAPAPPAPPAPALDVRPLGAEDDVNLNSKTGKVEGPKPTAKPKKKEEEKPDRSKKSEKTAKKSKMKQAPTGEPVNKGRWSTIVGLFGALFLVCALFDAIVIMHILGKMSFIAPLV